MLVAAVALDSVTPNFQQRLLTRGSKASEAEVMLFTNLLGLIPLSTVGIATGVSGTHASRRLFLAGH